jgi:threonine synthase
MGAGISRFISASNANTVVPEYFETGEYRPRPSVQTYSNAMDVGNPSNFARLQALYGNDLRQMKADILSMSITDNETLEEMRRTYKLGGHVLDPHTAVGVAAARRLKASEPSSASTIVAATAHPAKFPEVVSTALNISIPLPRQLQEALSLPKHSVRIPADYDRVKEVLLS